MAIAVYVRKSIEREHSISCETQLEYCKAVLKPEERTEPVRSFVDNGVSGGTLQRDGFQQMMLQIEQGQIHKVIVYRLDRISRSLVDFVGILETLKKHNVQFVSSQESFDTSTPYGEMIVKILMVFAEFERQSIIERVTQAYHHRLEKKFYMGGRRPYGFILTDTEIQGIPTKKLIPESTEIQHIQCIFETYAVSGMSLHRLINHLHQVFPSEGLWSAAKLSAILKNPIYVKADHAVYEYFARHNTNIISDIQEFDGKHGLQLYGQTKHRTADWSDLKIVVMTHEGIIASDVWLQCQHKLEKNKHIGTSLSNSTSWLGGMLVCKTCGRTMTVTKGGKRADGSQTRYFQCTGKTHYRTCEGPRVTLYADSLEDLVRRLIAEKLSSLPAARIKGDHLPSEQINPLQNRLTELNKSQDKLVELLLNEMLGTDMLQLLNEKIKTISEEQQKILHTLEAIEQTEYKIIHADDFTKQWSTACYEEQKAVCRVLIDKLYIHADGTIEVIWNI